MKTFEAFNNGKLVLPNQTIEFNTINWSKKE